MKTIKFDYEYIDIVDILKSTIALGEYRGDEICTEIVKLMDIISDDTLLLIDIKQVIWLNTAFCQPAFGPVFQSLMKRIWSKKYIIFQMHDYHKPAFFQGILKSYKIDISRKESESKFISSKKYIKLIVGNEKNINFIGELNEKEYKTLDVVNDLKQATAMQVVDNSGLEMEDVVDTLRSLARSNYFVIEHIDNSENQIHYYYSFYNYLERYFNNEK